MLLLKNAQFHTLDPEIDIVDALLLDGGRVLAVGSYDVLVGQILPDTQQEDLGGGWVLPGFTDAHIHLQSYAFSLQKINCETATRAECLQRVAERARTAPPGTWILGHGWNQNVWDEGFGNAADLDAVAPNNPVYLTAKSLHAGWANSSALRHAGVHAATPDPSGGRIGRLANGSPSGILFESAMGLMQDALPEASPEEIEAVIQAALPHLWAMGLTGAHDFDRRDCFIALQKIHARGELQFRVLKSIPLENLSHAIGVGLRTGFGDDFLRIGGIKCFADGALGPHTAAMLEPYEDDPENRGMLLIDAEELFEHGREAAQNGLSLAIHAIGDRANHEVLNALAQLRDYERQNNLPALRHRIEHVQVIHSQDADRLARLGVIASMQPIHAISDMDMADRFWGSRSRLAYAWRTQQGFGAYLAFGSDAPVESPNPFWGIHAALTRYRPDTPSKGGWYPEQCLDRRQAIEAYTRGAAYAAGLEDCQGSLAPGAFADLILLDRDPFHCPVDEIRAIKPVATMVAGEWVFQK